MYYRNIYADPDLGPIFKVRASQQPASLCWSVPACPPHSVHTRTLDAGVLLLLLLLPHHNHHQGINMVVLRNHVSYFIHQVTMFDTPMSARQLEYLRKVWGCVRLRGARGGGRWQLCGALLTAGGASGWRSRAAHDHSLTPPSLLARAAAGARARDRAARRDDAPLRAHAQLPV
jgi:hypothetical protein